MSLLNQLLADRYRIDRLLARGGMADVYLATDERLERQVAVKVIYPHLAADPRGTVSGLEFGLDPLHNLRQHLCVGGSVLRGHCG